VIGTVLYGAKAAALVYSEADIANFDFFQKIIFHGTLYSLSIPPILATVVYIQSKSSKEIFQSKILLVFSSVVTLFALLVWGQRSTAILSAVCSFAIVIFAKKTTIKKIVLPVILTLIFVYSAVTFVRNSQIVDFLAGVENINIEAMYASLGESSQENGGDLLSRGFVDLSYRAAGLEAVAAIVSAQSNGGLELRWGATSLSGLMSALPSLLRPEDGIISIKTAPFDSGLFSNGDWVTTLLSELTFDFGAFLIFFPAIICGFLLTLLDRLLYIAGQNHLFHGFLLIRILFLIFIISRGDSIASMTILLFKALSGLTFLLIAIAVAIFLLKGINFRFKK